MKTNVTLVSESRELFGITIRQETKTGFLNLSDLQRAYDAIKPIKGWSNRTVEDVLATKQNHERLFYILEKTASISRETQGFIKPDFLGFMEDIKKKGVSKVLKDHGSYSTKGARSNKSTWCDPYIWVLVAMEMNPELYATVVTWLTDGLILNRIGAGDMYIELSRALSRFHDVDYRKIAQAMNYIVFGKHETGIRNKGTKEQLLELEKLESNLAFMIDNDSFSSFEEVIQFARNIWIKKNNLTNG